jgi:hypothetical protein
MRRKSNLGKKTMHSVETQVTSMLETKHRERITVKSIERVRYDHGMFFLVSYHTIAEPEKMRSQHFAHQKTGNFCDVWLESPFNAASCESAA